MTIRISRDDDGTLDEVTARGADVHLEAMDDTAWCLIIRTPERTVTVDLGVRWIDPGLDGPDRDDLARLGLEGFAGVEVDR